MNHENHPHNITPAAQMEAEERALVKDERCADYLHAHTTNAEKSSAHSEAVPNQEQIHPQVTLNTRHLSENHPPSSADEMEAEERELVIEDSVIDVLTYAQKTLSDAEIRERAITREAEIEPTPQQH